MGLSARWDAVVRSDGLRPAAIVHTSAGSGCVATTTIKDVDSRATALCASWLSTAVAVAVCVQEGAGGGLAELVVMIAAMKAGVTFVPLGRRMSLLDELLDTVGGDVVVLVHCCAATAPPPASLFIRCAVVVVDAGGNVVSTAAPQSGRNGVGEATITMQGAFCMLYTSGSSGSSRPKGVLLSEAALLARFEWMWSAWPFRKDELVVRRTPLTFVDSLWEVLGAWLQGVPLLLGGSAAPLLQRGSVREFLGVLRRARATRITLVPSLLDMMLKVEPRLFALVPTMRVVIVSGEVLTSSLVRRFRSNNATLLNLFGSTEVCGDCTCAVITPECCRGDGDASEVPIGRAITDSVTLHIVDPDSGGVGELFVTGPTLALGYHNRSEEENRRHFVQLSVQGGESEPVASVCRAFRTGDLVRRDQSGVLYFHGRVDNQVKIRGVRVGLESVEAAVSRVVGSGGLCAVARPLGENDDSPSLLLAMESETLAAWFRRRRHQRTTAGGYDSDEAQRELHLELRRVLPTPTMAPSLMFLINGQLPLISPNNKLDRPAVEALIETRLRERAAATIDALGNDSTAVAVVLAARVADIVGLPPQPPAEASFFHLGGGSLKAAVLLHAIHERWGVRLQLSDLEQPLATVATRIDELKAARAPPHRRIASTTASPQESSARKRRRRSCASPLPVSTRTWSIGRARRCHPPNTASHVQSDTGDGPATTAPEVAVAVKKRWAVDLSKCVDASPLVACCQNWIRPQPAVFIGSHSHAFCRVDLSTGDVVWRVDNLGGRVESSGVLSSSGDAVLFGCYDGHCFALSCDDGSTLWRVQTRAEVKCSPISDGRGVCFFGSHDGELRAVAENSGDVLWSFDCGGAIYASPVLFAGGMLVATTGGVLAAFALSPTVSLTWRTALAAPIFSSPALSGDDASDIACLGCADGNIFGVSTRTGSTLWSVATGQPVFSSPCFWVDDGGRHFFIGSHDGLLRCVAVSGDLVWAADLADGPIYADPFVFRLRTAVCVCALTVDGGLFILCAVTGKELGRCSRVGGGHLFGSPVVVAGGLFNGGGEDVDDVVVVPCRDDKTYCFSVNLLPAHIINK